MKTTHLEFNEISGDVARCTKCNFVTSQIRKPDIGDKIPKRILEYNDKFWKCHKYDQIYWEGTHMRNLQEFIQKIKSCS
ncbi:MAG: Mut7-C RNAse domain-containing protein [Nitrosopumilus sp.]